MKTVQEDSYEICFCSCCNKSFETKFNRDVHELKCFEIKHFHGFKSIEFDSIERFSKDSYEFLQEERVEAFKIKGRDLDKESWRKYS